MNIPFPLEYDGSPEGHVKAPYGWLCRDLSGPKVYQKLTGETLNTGWVEFPSDTSAAIETGIAAAVSPANSVVPAITGTAQDEETLTCSTGTWSKASTYTYQWQSSDDEGDTWEDIDGETANTYEVVTADVGNILRCVVTAHNIVADSGAVPSEPTDEVIAA